MIRRPPRSTLSSSSAASDVYKRQGINAEYGGQFLLLHRPAPAPGRRAAFMRHHHRESALGFRVLLLALVAWMVVSQSSDEEESYGMIDELTDMICDPDPNINSHADCRALIHFYHNTGHALNWQNATDYCTWDEVFCDTGTPKRVHTVDMFNRNLTGHIPHCGFVTAPHCHDFDDMNHLRELVLSNNKFYGTIPDTLQDLTSLQELSMGSNQISGTIPSWVQFMTALQHLQAQNNKISGTLPSELGVLTRLEHLGFSANSLSGTLPEALNTLTSLNDLFMDRNNFTHWTANSSICSLFADEDGDPGTLNDCDISNNPHMYPCGNAFYVQGAKSCASKCLAVHDDCPSDDEVEDDEEDARRHSSERSYDGNPDRRKAPGVGLI
eukprot:TRINITY_DN209_c0_g2_i1.p1 TRINITY_DN209_c0_g2~~TRINITY_DN209_c0_g2_i1.p1  ORF type:complete len:383 (-),score=84.81 TRINITY_DN209_c0_g2_i1:179-1327(-)